MKRRSDFSNILPSSQALLRNISQRVVWKDRKVNWFISMILIKVSTKELQIKNRGHTLVFHQVEFAPPVGYVEPERQERREEKKEEEVQCLLLRISITST